MSETKTNEIAKSITYLAEQLRGESTGSTIPSINIVNAIDRVAHSLWDGLRSNGFDSTIPDGLFAVSVSLDKIADAIKKEKGDS